MLTEVAENEVQQYVEDFRRRIRSELSGKGKKRFSFSGGESGEGENYEVQTSYGLLSILIDEKKARIDIGITSI